MVLLVDGEHIGPESEFKLLSSDFDSFVLGIGSGVDSDLLSLVRLVFLGVALTCMYLEFIVLVSSQSWRWNKDLNHVSSFWARRHEQLYFFQWVVIFFRENDVSGYSCVVCFYRQECVGMVIQNWESGNSFWIGQCFLEVSVVLDCHSDEDSLQIDQVRVFDRHKDLLLLGNLKSIVQDCVSSLERRDDYVLWDLLNPWVLEHNHVVPTDERDLIHVLLLFVHKLNLILVFFSHIVVILPSVLFRNQVCGDTQLILGCLQGCDTCSWCVLDHLFGELYVYLSDCKPCFEDLNERSEEPVLVGVDHSCFSLGTMVVSKLGDQNFVDSNGDVLEFGKTMLVYRSGEF